MVRAQTTKSLLQVNSKQLETKFKSALFSPEDYRNGGFDMRRPASSATAHFTSDLVGLSSRRASKYDKQNSSLSSGAASPFALFQQKFGGTRRETGRGSNPTSV